MATEKAQKPAPKSSTSNTASGGKAKPKSASTDPNKQPGFEEQERALSPTGTNSGGSMGGSAEPKLGKVRVVSVTISAARKLTAVLEAKISGANGKAGTTTRTYTVTGNDSMSPFECAEVIYDQFQKIDMSDVGLESSYNIDPYGKKRDAFMEEAISAVFDKGRLNDQRDRSAWSAEEKQRFDVRP